jgi:hypothetical protein
MNDNLTPSLEGKLPSPTQHADAIAKWVPTIAMAFAGIWYPESAFAGAVYQLVYEKFVERPKRLLLGELRKGNVQNLSNEQLVPFVPMAYKFFEAAKEGEYEHNLRILAAFLRGELEQEIPDEANFARMVRRVEGLSLTDLRVMTMIDAFVSANTKPDNARPFVSATPLGNPTYNKHSLSKVEIQEALVDLAARGFLVTDGATSLSKHEEYYFASSNLVALIDRAREHIELIER